MGGQEHDSNLERCGLMLQPHASKLLSEDRLTVAIPEPLSALDEIVRFAAKF